MSDIHGLYGWLVVFALFFVTVLTRSFFLLPQDEPRLPNWLNRGLRHAPVAALLAMVAPEIFLNNGQLLFEWHDAKLIAVGAALSYYYLRSRTVTGTILLGTATYVLMRVALGWH